MRSAFLMDASFLDTVFGWHVLRRKVRNSARSIEEIMMSSGSSSCP